MEIKTNNIPRPIIFWDDLTEKEKQEFDYLDSEEKQQSAYFFRYKKWVFCFDEFSFVPSDSSNFKGWSGYKSDSFFSGVLIKDCEDLETVVCGTYFC